MCESTNESAEIADSGRKGTTACEQSTISHGETYRLIRSNLLSLIAGFDRIDAAVIKTTNQTFKVHRSIQFNRIMETHYRR